MLDRYVSRRIIWILLYAHLFISSLCLGQTFEPANQFDGMDDPQGEIDSIEYNSADEPHLERQGELESDFENEALLPHAEPYPAQSRESTSGVSEQAYENQETVEYPQKGGLSPIPIELKVKPDLPIEADPSLGSPLSNEGFNNPQEPIRAPEESLTLLDKDQIEDLALMEINKIFEQLKVEPKPRVFLQARPLPQPSKDSPNFLLTIEMSSEHSVLLEKEARKRVARALSAKGFKFHHLSPFIDNAHSSPTNLQNLNLQLTKDPRPLVIISTPLKMPMMPPSSSQRMASLVLKTPWMALVREQLKQLPWIKKIPTSEGLFLLGVGGVFLMLIGLVNLLKGSKRPLKAKISIPSPHQEASVEQSHAQDDPPFDSPTYLPDRIPPPEALLPPIFTPKVNQTPIMPKTPPPKESVPPLSYRMAEPQDFYSLPILRASRTKPNDQTSDNRVQKASWNQVNLQQKYRRHPVSILSIYGQKKEA